MQVANVQLFLPSGVQIFGVVDPDALNANFNSIAAAFNAESALTGETASVQLTATLRNVLVDVSAASANTTVIVTLPDSPSVNDPPCVVAMKADGTAIPTNCIVTTGTDGNFINGITPDNVNHTNQPGLYCAGDQIEFVFVGGRIGWLAIATLGTPALAGAWTGSGALPWQDQTALITGAAANFSVEALQAIGVSASVINNSGGAITGGDATSTFNGTAGPYSLADATRATITNIGTRAFVVTT